MVINMHRQWLLVPAVFLAVIGISTSTLAQDRLEAIVTKRKITNRDRAKIEAEVAQRAKRLADAGKDDHRRNVAREILLKTSQISGTTQAGLDAYAEACASELASLTTSELFETSFDAISVLIELDNVNTAEALAAALRSRHAATRFRAARGLQRMHKKLANHQRACRKILRALGDAGAVEKQDVVLRVIYEAIDLSGDVKNPGAAEGCAHALNTVFESRLEQLESGKRNETVDLPGLRAAANCYAATNAEQKALLIGSVARFLTHTVDRYVAADTAEDHLPVLAKLIKTSEATIHSMIKASQKRPPSKKVGSVLNGRAPTSKTKQDARDALTDLAAILRGDPWNLP